MTKDNKRTDLEKIYKARVEEYSNYLEEDRKAILWLSLSRLLVFVGGIILSVYTFRISNIVGFATLLLSIIIFAFLLKIYTKRSWLRDYHQNMLKINSDELSTVNEEYADFNDGLIYNDPAHSFSHDIDLFGPGSLFQSINRTSTAKGEARLADCLLKPFRLSKDFINRSESVKELSGETDWRHRFLALGMMNKISSKEFEDFSNWMKEDPQFSNSKILRLALLILPLICSSLIVLSIIGTLNASFLITFILINLFLIALNLGSINRIHARVSKKSDYLTTIGSLIQHIEEREFQSDYLISSQKGLGDANITALSKVKKLARIIHSFDSRMNMLMGVVLNGLFLWDYQCVVRIEGWKNEVSHLVPTWFNTIADIDALCSLSGYARNNPAYVYPEISSNEIFLDAKNMGHHLIKSKKRISNDYLIPARGAINIITGANMAGKSTFLRTVTTNMVLAMCGVPVCADRFIFTPVDIFTSMRTTDSLSEEESYFFAELKRLRQLIERIEKEKDLFFVLDEILKGTNSKDKSEGSKAFIKKVLDLGGTGMVATHDISLGSLEEDHQDKVSNNSFEIEIDNGEVMFDFILRKGITTKMNAALLMKQQGII